jgi:hypothetical protein
MAVTPVTTPQPQKQQGMGMLGGILQMFPMTAGVGTALKMGQGALDSQAANSTPAAQPVNSSFDNGAMGRRKELMNTDHGTELKTALAAIDSSDWDDERKKQLRAPIEQAMYKGGYA